MTLLVCPLSQVEAALALRPSHMLSLISPDAPLPPAPGIAPSRRLVLRFNDIAAPMPGLVPPDREIIKAIIGFARGWNRDAPLLIHCWAGNQPLHRGGLYHRLRPQRPRPGAQPGPDPAPRRAARHA